MNLVFLTLLISATPQDLALKDASQQLDQDVRYLDTSETKNPDDYLAMTSFVLNSISNKKVIVRPKFVDKDKTLIRFHLKDYGIIAKAYDKLGKNKRLHSDKLNMLLKCENPILKVEYFLINALRSPVYYDFIGVSDLKDFRERVGILDKKQQEFASVVDSDKKAVGSRKVIRYSTFQGYVWETYDRYSDKDFLQDLFSDKFDSIEVLGSNYNGFLLYFAGSGDGKSLDFVDPNISMIKAGDNLVRVSRNCVLCHGKSGVINFECMVRKVKATIMLKNVKSEDDWLVELFSRKLPFKRDRVQYEEAVQEATGLTAEKVSEMFAETNRRYYERLTLEQAAKELGMKPKDLKDKCAKSNNIHLLMLLFNGKITREAFEKLENE